MAVEPSDLGIDSDGAKSTIKKLSSRRDGPRYPWEVPTPDPKIALRDWFAGMALGATKSNRPNYAAAADAYKLADAMIKAREPDDE